MWKSRSKPIYLLSWPPSTRTWGFQRVGYRRHCPPVAPLQPSSSAGYHRPLPSPQRKPSREPSGCAAVPVPANKEQPLHLTVSLCRELSDAPTGHHRAAWVEEAGSGVHGWDMINSAPISRKPKDVHVLLKFDKACCNQGKTGVHTVYLMVPKLMCKMSTVWEVPNLWMPNLRRFWKYSPFSYVPSLYSSRQRYWCHQALGKD